MVTTNRKHWMSDMSGWDRTAFIANKFNSTLATYEEMELNLSRKTDPKTKNLAVFDYDPNIMEYLSGAESDSRASDIPPVAFRTIGKCRDATLGGNDVINPFYQFCRNDDLCTNYTKGSVDVLGADIDGMGRVYSEMYDDNQVILWMAFGNDVYNYLASFYSKAVNTSLASAVIKGPETVTAGNIGRLVGLVSVKIVLLPLFPIYIVNYLYRSMVSVPITRYYDFKNQMPLYYRYVNTITLILASNLGFRDQEYQDDRFANTQSATASKTNLDATNKGLANASAKDAQAAKRSDGKVLYGNDQGDNYVTAEAVQYDALSDQEKLKEIAGKVPVYGDVYAFDIFSIMNKKALYERAQAIRNEQEKNGLSLDRVQTKLKNNLKITRTDSLLLAKAQVLRAKEKQNSSRVSVGDTSRMSPDQVDLSKEKSNKELKKGKNWMWEYISAAYESYSQTLYNQSLYIGFRIDKTTQATESFTNSTGPAEVKGTLNSKFGELQNLSFLSMNGQLSANPLAKIVEGTLKTVAGFADGAIQAITGIGGATAISTGAVRIDIPDIWQDSTFVKSYNFNIELAAGYGNPISIMQDLYYPTACILAATIPLATGASSYTSPFKCQAFVKGLFGCSLGIIDNLTISRGHDRHGITPQRLPTSINIAFTIKDLSPTMYMALGDGYGLFDTVIGNNTTMMDYLNTLSGFGLVERTDRSGFWEWKRQIKNFFKVDLYNKVNPRYWGMIGGSKTPMRAVINMFNTQSYNSNN